MCEMQDIIQEGQAVSMGVYLNSKKPYLLFREDFSSTYFVDKTEILKELVPLVESVRFLTD